MRGAIRIQVLVLLALSGATTGGLAGFAAGALPVPSLGRAAIAVAVVAAVLDALGVPALAVPRQVPQYWGRIFPPRTVALLYGARLGVGPLTLLPTWLWWAAMVIAASHGPWTAAATGAAFAVARVATMALAGTASRSLDGLDRAVRLGIAVVAITAAMAACSNDEDGSEPAPATPTSLELTPSTTTTTTPEDRTLADLLLDDSLPGFDRADDALGTGVMDLEAAAEAETDVAAERALLETRGFQRGVSRAWLGPDDDVVYVASYELGSRAQAEAYLVDGAETLAARAAEPFDVTDVPGAVGFTTTDGDFVAHAVAFTRDHRWFLVLVGSSVGARTFTEAIELAVAQAARVPAP